jgi:hypothetical protein
VDWAIVKLSRAFPGSFPDAGTVAEKTKLYVELLSDVRHGWITPEAWKDGVLTICWTHKGAFVPEPAALITACRTEVQKVREAAHTAAVFAERPQLTDSEAGTQAERNIARIKAAIREGFHRTAPLQTLHADLVSTARAAGYGAESDGPGLSDAGSAWVRREYARARQALHSPGGLASFVAAPLHAGQAVVVGIATPPTTPAAITLSAKAPPNPWWAGSEAAG